MTTHSITLSDETKTLSPSNPENVQNGDTVDLKVISGSQLTVESLDIDLVVDATGSDSSAPNVVASEQGADLTITGVTLKDNQTIKYEIDHQSSMTYIVQAGQTSALNSTTFHFQGTGGEGNPGDLSESVLKFVIPSALDNSMNPAITNLQVGDKILLEIDNGDGTFSVPDGYEFVSTPAGSFLQLSKDGQVQVKFALPQGYTPGLDYQMQNGTFVVACYLRDTLIATPEGQKPVQDLQPGDSVLTASGRVATVKWLGYRKMHASRIPADQAIRAYPVRIAAGALAPNVPTRDLYISPYHHMYFNGQLIPAMLLVNGQTITQDFSRRSFEYFHVELDRFDILLAEGAAAESYVDTGNRSMFQNVNVVTMQADFGPPEGRQEIEGMEIVRNGPKAEAIRKHLLKRAEALTKAKRVSDPDLRIEVDGREIRPEATDQAEGVKRFVLPAGVQASDVRILSRSSIVRDTAVHARRDLRRVGVGLARITIEDAAGRREIDLRDDRLRGLQGLQDVHGVAMRWTTGTAVIPATLHAAQGPAVLELHVLRTYSYWSQPQQLAA